MPEPLPLPLFGASVAAGFPSPADDFLEGQLDLNTHVIKHPAATYFVRAASDAMRGAGIFKGDVMVVDRSLTPTPGAVVVASVDGRLYVRRLERANGSWMLRGEQGKPPLNIGETLEVWGVVTTVIHKV